MEHIFTYFSVGGCNFVIGDVYIPPKSSHIIYESHVNFVEYLIKLYPNHTFIIFGDYNIPEVSWDNDVDGLTYHFSQSSSVYCIPESFFANNFFQMNFIPNCSNNSLDLILCNVNSLTVEKSFEPAVSIDPYHPALTISLPSFLPLSNCNSAHTFYNFCKVNYTSICSFLSSFDWFSSLLNYDAEFAFNIFFDALHIVYIRVCTKFQLP